MSDKSKSVDSEVSPTSINNESPDQSKKILALMYLGRRGGGAQLTSELYQDLSNELDSVHLIVADDIEVDFQELATHNISALPGIHNIQSLFGNLPRFLVRTIKLATQLRNLSKLHIVIVMIHPLDRLLLRIVRLFNSNVIVTVILHEIESRDRRNWPNKTAISFYLKNSDRVILLNKDLYNSDAISNYVQKSRLARLTHKSIYSDLQNPYPELNYILCIGRNEPYKDLNLLIESWNELQIKNRCLIIAGEGTPKIDATNLIILNDWIEEKRFLELIKFSRFLVLPYKNATQSGILAFAEHFNKTCVMTPVKSLVEQAGGLAIVAENFTSEALSRSISMADEESEIGVSRRSNAEGDSIRDVILEIFQDIDF